MANIGIRRVRLSWNPSPTPMNIHLRAPVPADAPVAGKICYDAFKTISQQHGFPPDLPAPEVAIGLMGLLLSRADVHGVVAEVGGKVVGSNFLWAGDPVAGVGPITVDPDRQNGAIGRRLMEAVLTRARQMGISAVRLVQAAYHTRSLSLYTKLGFVSREPLAVMQGAPLGLSISGHAVRPATEADLAGIDDLCLRVHGHPRTTEVGHAIKQGTAMVVERAGRITGYTTGLGFFGHSVGETTADLQALIGAAPSFSGLGFLLPIRDADLFRWCLEQGLRVVQPMTLMSSGPYNEPKGAFLPSILY
jgi:GNAT superfamily N-acetyltransferase